MRCVLTEMYQSLPFLFPRYLILAQPTLLVLAHAPAVKWPYLERFSAEDGKEPISFSSTRRLLKNGGN